MLSKFLNLEIYKIFCYENVCKHILHTNFADFFQYCRVFSKFFKFSIKDFFNKCDQISRKLRIWSHLLKKSLMEYFIFCAVNVNAKM